MATQTNNMVLLEKAPGSDLLGQHRTIGSTDDLVLSPATVAIAPTGNVSINSTGGSLSMGDAASTQAINIGTAGARVITLGQGVGVGPTIVLNGSTNTTIIESMGALSIGSTFTGAETVNLASVSGGALGYVRTLNIGSSNTTSANNIYAGSGGTNVFGPFAVASTTNAISLTSTSGAITIDGTGSGTIGIGTAGGIGAISVGTAASNRNIVIGNGTNTSQLRLNGGSGGITLSTNGTAGEINIGTDNGVGTISIGTGTVTRAISIATGANDGAVNIGTSASPSGGRTTTIGSTTGTSRLVLTGGSGTAGGLAAIQIGNDTGTGTISIASSTGARQVDIGNGATSTATVNIVGAGATAARAVNVGTGGTGAKTVTIGDGTVAASVTAIRGGSTSGVQLNDSINSPVNIATGTSTGTINLGGSAAQTINIGTGSGQKSISIGSQTDANTGVSVQAGASGSVTFVAGQGVVFGGPSRQSPGTIIAFNANVGGGFVEGELAVCESTAINNLGQPVIIKANCATAGAKGFTGVALGAIAINNYRGIASVSGTVTKVLFKSGAGNEPTAGDSGKPVYISDTDGQATMTAPSASGSRVFVVGYLTSVFPQSGSRYWVQLMPQFIADIP